MTASGMRRAAAALLGAAVALALARSPLDAVAGAAAALAAEALVRSRAARRRAEGRSRALRAALPDALDLLAAALDGGAAPAVALPLVCAYMPEPFSGLVAEAASDAGEGMGAAVAAADPALRPLGALLRQSEELGVPIADALRLLAADTRALLRVELRERAAAAAPRMMLVVGSLLAPAALLIVIGGQVLYLRDTAGGVLG